MEMGEDFFSILFSACRHDLSPSWLGPGLGSRCPWTAGEGSNLLGIRWQFALLHYAWAENTEIKYKEQEIIVVFLI